MGLLDVGFHDGSGVGVVEFGGLGAGGEVGGYEVVKREAGWERRRVSTVEKGNGSETRKTMRGGVQGMLSFFVGVPAGYVALERCAPGDIVHLGISDLPSGHQILRSIKGISPSARYSRTIEACRGTR